MKKLLAFVCGLVPFGAMAVDPTIIDYGNSAMSGLSVTSGSYARVVGGPGLALGSGGLSSNYLFVGQTGPAESPTPAGEIFVEPTIPSPNYSIRSDGNVSIATLLEVLEGYSLGIGAKTDGATIATMNIGEINAVGALTIADAGTFTSDDISSANTLSISANTISTGAINSTAGNTTINSTGAFSLSGNLIADGNAVTKINVGSISSTASIQNKTGKMEIDAGTGVIGVGGNFENKSGQSLTVVGGAMTVDGTMTNESGTMTLNLASLRINGGTGDEASFVNGGNLGIVVIGETRLANGFDLSAMDEDNTFSLKTGTLVLDGGADSLLQVFANNKLEMFELEVNSGSISTAGNIINGQSNPDANMTLTVGGNISAATIQNYGDTFNVSTIEDTAGNITIGTAAGTGIYGVADSVTTVVADGTLSVVGAVSNNGTMTLNGNVIELSSVSNTDTLTIAAQTDPTGRIAVSGNVTNTTGTTDISARQIAIDGVVKNIAGTTTITGSDASGASMVIGGVDVAGGTMALNASIGSASVTNDLLVSNGVFNVGTSTYNLSVGGTSQIAGNVNLVGTPTTHAGDMNILNSGVNRFVLASTGAITIDGNVVAEDDAVARSATFASNTVEVGGDVSVANKGSVAFGNAGVTTLDIAGDALVDDGGVLEFYSGTSTMKSLSNGDTGKIIAHGANIIVDTDSINISNGIWFDGTLPSALTKGMIVADTDSLLLQSENEVVDITGGISVANGNELTLLAATNANVSGNINVDTGELIVTATDDVTFSSGTMTVTGDSSENGVVTVNAENITTGAISNGQYGVISLGTTADTALVQTNGLVSNAGAFDIAAAQVAMASFESTGGVSNITATNALQSGALSVSGGNVTLSGSSIGSTSLTITGGTTKLKSATVNVAGNVSVSNGDLNQGGSVGNLILDNSGTITANNISVSNGKFVVDGNNVAYNITNNFNAGNGIDVNAGIATISAPTISTNNGDINVASGAKLVLNATNSFNFGAIDNDGTFGMTTDGVLNAVSIENNTGRMEIVANSMSLSATPAPSTDAFVAGGKLYHNSSSALASLAAGDVNIISNDDFVMSASDGVSTNGIKQYGSSKLTIQTSDLSVNGDIDVNDFLVSADPANDWLTVDVNGDVSTGAQFIGVQHMNIAGDYTFGDNSMLEVVVLPYGTGANQTIYNYWSTVETADADTLGKIYDPSDAAALITVGGKFSSSVETQNVGVGLNGTELVSPQMGVNLFSVVDNGTAIWLLDAQNGVDDSDLASKIRNLNVNFCNSDGSLCFSYFKSAVAGDSAALGTEAGLPAYLTVRDRNDDGQTDSVYIVFDSRFGGPVKLFKIQPLVGALEDHTNGEYESAGALDDLLAAQLAKKNFDDPVIEAIPVAFRGTNLETLATELYNRMEQFLVDQDRSSLARFSRLTQPREVEQLATSIALDEHTTFRDFEDHMMDEFIWNRHRSLKKAWLDIDYGWTHQKAHDGKNIDGNRFSIFGGYDWQHSKTLILGVAGRISHMSADDTDDIDLSYLPGQTVNGRVDVSVADTDIGIGAYLMKILGTKARLYGNGFLDLHLLDVSREQNFVSKIDGSGSAFSIISEWGLLHDVLNQYIVGNLYARIGYNFGFSIKEKSGGDNYMQLKFDDYAILTPGYTLTLQKRIYPSSWFQIRPYASVGVEYDVLGMPEYTRFKFDVANHYTKYDVDANPLWANIGGGVELLSATGFQLGLDYRYQYNSEIRLHKIRVAGSYRF